MKFYFSVHPCDLIRERLLEGSRLLLVASSLWKGGRLRVRRPPRSVALAGLALDSGGFTAARKWGSYPWSAAEYAAWARNYLPLDWVAVMDYACERGVDRSALATNAERVAATVANACRCREADPSLPWLPVVQGYSPEEYRHCADLYRREGWSLEYAGVGTVCGRKAAEAARLLAGLRHDLPGSRLHVFGLDMRALRDDEAAASVESWDSYAWNWSAGEKGSRYRLPRGEGETYSSYCRKLATAYRGRVERHTGRARQGLLF